MLPSRFTPCMGKYTILAVFQINSMCCSADRLHSEQASNVLYWNPTYPFSTEAENNCNPVIEIWFHRSEIIKSFSLKKGASSSEVFLNEFEPILTHA
jgi:hypothetical protein